MSDTLETISPWDKPARKQVEALLAQEGISRDANLDYTIGIFDDDNWLAATGNAWNYFTSIWAAPVIQAIQKDGQVVHD